MSLFAVLVAAALASSEPRLNAESLRSLALSSCASAMEPATPSAFQFSVPVVSDTRTDIAALQTPAGYSYDAAAGVLTIDVDLAAVTPNTFTRFDADGLDKSPPLRVLYFDTRSTRTQTALIRDDRTSDSAGIDIGYVVMASSIGLAIATSTKDFGRGGGDLPDKFELPLLVRVKATAGEVRDLVRGLHLQVQGSLRSIVGRRVLCGEDEGDGYAVDGKTTLTSHVLKTRQWLLPAVITRLDLVRRDGSVLRSWSRAEAAPIGETPQTAVIMAGGRQREAPSITHPATIVSPLADPSKHRKDDPFSFSF